MPEIELKFVLPPECRTAIGGAQLVLASRRETLRAHYYDTAGAHLAAAGLSLRTRRSGRRWEQTLKAPSRARIERHEETAMRPGVWGADGPAPDLSLHAGSAAARLLDQALVGAAAGSPVALQRVSTITVDRRVARHVEAGGEVEIAFDQGRIEAAGRAASLCEIEYELKSGDASALLTVARAGALAHGLWLTSIAKSQRGERLRLGQPHGPAVHALTPAIDATMSGTELVRALAANCIEQIIGNASEIAEGVRDEEHVHQLRIGIRRLRTVMRELGALGPGLRDCEAPLAAAFRDLGLVRDRQGAVGVFADELKAAGAPPMCADPGGAGALPDPVAVVRDRAFQDALLQSTVFVFARPPDTARHSPAAARPLREQLAEVLGALHRRLRRDAQRFERLDPERQHAVRKRLKRLRYLTELLAPLYPRKAVERYLKHLKPAQEALGRHTDRAIAAGLYRRFAEAGQASAWFAVGWLEAKEPSTAAAGAVALQRLRDRDRFW